jgi:hypothetical protein
VTDLDFDRPGRGRIAKRRAFYIAPELERQVREGLKAQRKGSLKKAA